MIASALATLLLALSATAAPTAPKPCPPFSPTKSTLYDEDFVSESNTHFVSSQMIGADMTIPSMEAAFDKTYGWIFTPAASFHDTINAYLSYTETRTGQTKDIQTLKDESCYVEGSVDWVRLEQILPTRADQVPDCKVIQDIRGEVSVDKSKAFGKTVKSEKSIFESTNKVKGDKGKDESAVVIQFIKREGAKISAAAGYTDSPQLLLSYEIEGDAKETYIEVPKTGSCTVHGAKAWHSLDEAAYLAK